jgi:hypothetical protein
MLAPAVLDKTIQKFVEVGAIPVRVKPFVLIATLAALLF